MPYKNTQKPQRCYRLKREGDSLVVSGDVHQGYPLTEEDVRFIEQYAGKPVSELSAQSFAGAKLSDSEVEPVL